MGGPAVEEGVLVQDLADYHGGRMVQVAVDLANLGLGAEVYSMAICQTLAILLDRVARPTEGYAGVADRRARMLISACMSIYLPPMDVRGLTADQYREEGLRLVRAVRALEGPCPALAEAEAVLLHG